MTSVDNLIESFFTQHLPRGRLSRTDIGVFPPCNIGRFESKSEIKHVITMAVAGYKRSNIEAFIDDDTLVIQTNLTDEMEDNQIPDGVNFTPLWTGLAKRHFSRKFRLPDGANVENVAIEDGLLTVEIVQRLPEIKKPVMLQIKGS